MNSEVGLSMYWTPTVHAANLFHGVALQYDPGQMFKMLPVSMADVK
ncbi:MAG: hypothetical protein IPP36_07665 [Nitrosomonadales bacterium]|nr:hypothetical protein [Nitrosomonadales bacterium]